MGCRTQEEGTLGRNLAISSSEIIAKKDRTGDDVEVI